MDVVLFAVSLGFSAFFPVLSLIIKNIVFFIGVLSNRCNNCAVWFSNIVNTFNPDRRAADKLLPGIWRNWDLQIRMRSGRR